jgi:hypothetical protein
MEILLFLFSIVLVESITELLTKSEIFSPVRAFFFNRRGNKVLGFLHKLLDCGYCTSVWSGWFVALLFFRDIGLISLWLDWFFIGLALQRMANTFHFMIDRLDRYKSIDVEGQG